MGTTKMKKERQVVSQELAKEMAELGFEQDSFWSWVHPLEFINEKGIVSESLSKWALSPTALTASSFSNTLESSMQKQREMYAAYTVAELGEMLPNNDDKNGEYVTIKTGGGKWLAWEIQKGLYNGEGSFIVTNTEADARAQMCIILRNTGLL